MRCCKCGASAPALKSVVCRDARNRRGVLCDPCWEPLADRLWILPGLVAAWGRCRECGEWFGVGELSDRKPGGGHGAMIGACVDCEEREPQM